jgi:hypothetical protein
MGKQSSYGGESADGLEEGLYLVKRGSKALMVAKAPMVSMVKRNLDGLSEAHINGELKP